jgi:hypothetical protein
MRALAVLLMALLMALPVRAELPAGLVYDDGFAYFQAVTVSTTENNRPTTRWYLQSKLRILGKVPHYSSFKTVLLKNGKAVRTLTQEAQVLGGGLPSLVTLQHADRTQPLTEAGNFTVQVYFVDGDTKTEHLARTHTIEVGTVGRVEGMGPSLGKLPPEFVVMQHGEILASILYLKARGFPSYTAQSGVHGIDPDYNTVELLWNHSPNLDGQSFNTARLRIRVNGKTVLKELSGIPQDFVHSTRAEFVAYRHTDRNAPQYQRGDVYSEYLRFQKTSMILPITFGKPAEANLVSLTENPGQWEIEFLLQGKPIRTWKFTVNPDGTIAPHPEQAAGLNLIPGATLVETIVPPGGSYADERVIPKLAQQGAFYGRPWVTSQGKALAMALPSKGSASPTPSR